MDMSMMNMNNMMFHTNSQRLQSIENEVQQQREQLMAVTPLSRPLPAPPTPEHEALLNQNHSLLEKYMALMKSHTELAAMRDDLIKKKATAEKPAQFVKMNKEGTKREAACLGVVRLDYNYPPAPGDIDSPESYSYDVYYRVVPGLTFEMCQSGKMTDDVKVEFVDAIRYLEKKGVSGITGDCGFMMYFQALARQHTRKPVFMSALAQLPAVTCAFSRTELIAVFTANSTTLAPMRDLIKDECGVDPDEKRFVIVGCQDVPGFEAVAAGDKVDVKAVTPGMVEKAKQVLKQHPNIRAFLLECTELPPYADAIRAVTGLPVYDAITACDYFITGMQDNKRFGLNDWQEAWDGKQEAYTFGSNLNAEERARLVNKVQDKPFRPESMPAHTGYP